MAKSKQVDSSHLPLPKRHCSQESLKDAVKNNDLVLAKKLILSNGLPEDHQESLDLLNICIDKKQEEMGKILVENGVKINRLDEGITSPLHAAIENGLESLAKVLIEKGADVNAKNVIEETPLHIAAFQGQVEVVQALVDYGAVIHVKNSLMRPGPQRIDDYDVYGMTPLENAVKAGHFEVMVILLSEARFQMQERHFILMLDLLLIVAARHAPKAMILALLSNGALVNPRWNRSIHSDFQIPYSSRALSSIIAYKRYKYRDTKEIIELLLRHGADINEQDDHGLTPLHYAAIHCTDNDIEIVKILFKHGADPNVRANFSSRGKTPLHCAAQLPSREELIKIFIDNGADVNDYTYDLGWGDIDKATPLHLAALKEQPKNVQILLQHGANVDAQNTKSNTALHLAVRDGIFKVGELFPDDQLSPDQVYLFKQAMEVMKLLLNEGANVNLANRDKMTPLHFAVALNYADVARILIQYGAKVDAKNIHSQTPMHMAVRNDSRYIAREGSKCIRILLQNGGNSNLKDKKGEKPLEYALRKNREKYVKTLLHCQQMK